MKNINKKGFTLIELLAVIVILAIILSLTIYIASGIINHAKQKTYDVTIANIVDGSNNYAIENKDALTFTMPLNEDYEYQCLTIQNLIDLGYLKNNVINSMVSDDKKVSTTDYIYIERNTNTKTITKNVYVVDANSQYGNICNASSNANGTISFVVTPDTNVWAKEKEVTIIYRLRNISDINEINNYQYNYSFSDVTDNGNFDNYTLSKKVTITSNGTINANIMSGDRIIATGNLLVSKIDTVGPTIELINDDGNVFNNERPLMLKVSDALSGVNYSTFTADDLEVFVGEYEISDFNLTKINDLGEYKLELNDTTHQGNVTINISSNSIFDNVGNGNDDKTIESVAMWKPREKAVITCQNKIFNENYQIIATCSGGTISNNRQVHPEDYVVTCKGDANHDDADNQVCSITGTRCYIASTDNNKCYASMSTSSALIHTYNRNESFNGYNTLVPDGYGEYWLKSKDYDCYVPGGDFSRCTSSTGGNSASSALGCSECSVSYTYTCNGSTNVASACGSAVTRNTLCSSNDPSTKPSNVDMCIGTVSWSCNGTSYNQTVRETIRINSYCSGGLDKDIDNGNDGNKKKDNGD